MKSREVSTNSASTTMSPYIAINDCANYQEMSHVFKCMQCDLQLQIDIAGVSRYEPHMIDEAVIRIRFDPGSMLQPKDNILVTSSSRNGSKEDIWRQYKQ